MQPMQNDLLRYKTLIQNLNAAVLVEDENRTISLVNQTFCDLFHIPAPPEALIGADCSESAQQSKGLFKDPEAFVAGVDKLLKDRQPVFNEPFELLDGTMLERDYIPIFDDEVYLGHLWVYKDLTPHYRLQHQLTEARNALAALSLTDPLTQLGNRRYIDSTLEFQMALAQRLGHSLSFVMIDLDDFKQVNDTYGHQKGDAVLQAFTEFLSSHLRKTDFLGRVGGEEFVMILPDTSAMTTSELIDKLLFKLQDRTLADLKISFSAGITELPPNMPISSHAGCINEIMHFADTAMYEAKSLGKNQWVVKTFQSIEH